MAALQLTSFALVWMAWNIYKNPDLGKHPAQFIGAMAICLAFNADLLLCIEALCRDSSNREWFFAATVYFDTSYNSQLRALNTLAYSWLTFYVVSYQLPMLIEMCLVYEMVQVLANPMQRADSRAKSYWIFITVTSLLGLWVASRNNF